VEHRPVFFYQKNPPNSRGFSLLRADLSGEVRFPQPGVPAARTEQLAFGSLRAPRRQPSADPVNRPRGGRRGRPTYHGRYATCFTLLTAVQCEWWQIFLSSTAVQKKPPPANWA